jgi:hypothetical protein
VADLYMIELVSGVVTFTLFTDVPPASAAGGPPYWLP